MKITLFWEVAQYNMLDVYRHFTRTYCLHHHGCVSCARSTTSRQTVFFSKTAVPHFILEKGVGYKSGQKFRPSLR